jgi:hypothetical protein
MVQVIVIRFAGIQEAKVSIDLFAEGAPKQIARNPKSYSGAYLKPVLARKRARRSAAE